MPGVGNIYVWRLSAEWISAVLPVWLGPIKATGTAVYIFMII